MALTVLCLFAAPTCAGQSAIWTVNTLADSNDGSCTATVCSLRDAITAANSDSGDRIYLLNLVGTITLTSPLPAITADMVFWGPGTPIDSLVGPYGMNLLTVSGNNLYPVFTINSGHVIIYGLVIANGLNSTYGGGIYVGSSGSLNLLVCTISGSYARYGGGIANYGTLIIDNSTISGNSTSNVGAGGGIYNSPGTTLQVTNSTFTGNSSSNTNGGAIFIDAGSTATLTNITVSGNSANTDGGLHAANGTNANPTTVTLNNSILTGNTNDDCASCATTPSTAFSFTNNDSYIGGISSGTAPALGPLQWNGGPTQTMMPLPGSSAICAGSTAFVSNPTFGDQRLFSLPSGDCPTGKLDQGAVQSMYLTVNSIADTATGTLSSCTDGGGTCTLRDAIHVAMNDTGTSANNSRNDGDIIFDSSVFGTVQKTITLGSSLDTISSALNIQGPGASLLTVNGNSSSGSGVTNSILYMISSSSSPPDTSAEVNISGLTLTNGIANSTTQEGGAIYNDGALSVVNSIISGSGTAGSGSGGGIFNDSPGMMLLTGSTVSGNSAAAGAGIFNNNFGEMLVIDSTISGNTAPSGGGWGGGIKNGGPLQLINSTLSGNTASDGGGIYNTGLNAVLTVTDSTISGNTAWNDDSASFGGGGGIDNYNDGIGDGDGLITVTNSIIAGNTSNGSDDLENCTSATSNCTLPVTDQYDLIDTVAHTSASGAYNIALAPLALNGPLATTQTMMPGPGSAAIQGGSAAEVPLGLTTDERGFPRLTGGNVDIGAVQTNYTSITFTQQPTTSVVNEFLATDPQVTLTETNSSNSATDNVSGVPVTLNFSGNIIMISGALTETTNASGMADFSGLKVNTTGTYTFNVAGSLAATGATVTSNSFDVTTLAPVVTGLNPNAGPIAGGTLVTINGNNLGGATAVNFGGTPATSYSYPMPTTLQAVAPAGTGTVDVTVTTANGVSALSVADHYTYLAPPTVTGIIPNAGTLAGGTPVTITGTNLSGATAVNFGTIAVTSFSVISATQITATSPAGAAGVVHVTVTTAGGTSATSTADQFTYIQTAFTVTTLVDDATGTATNCTNPAVSATSCNLRDAIAAATAADAAGITTTPTITFAATLCTNSGCTTTIAPTAGNPGTYNVTTGGTLFINTNMNIQGPGANLLSIDGGNSVLIFYVSSKTVSISRLTITNGNGNKFGGGFGGGILNIGSLTVSNCTFSGNYASYGGGIYNPGTTVTVSNSTFSGNTAQEGGGILNGGTLNVSNSTFSGNTAQEGGGILNSNTLTMSNSTFSGNTALEGGGIWNSDTMTVSNSTFSGNSASTTGGGIFNINILTMTNSTFSGNAAPSGSGPGIYNDNVIYLANNLSADNFANPSNNAIDDGGNVIAGWNSVSASSINLSALGNYGGPTQTMMPLPGSNGICSGTASPLGGLTLPPTDQRGNPRPTTVYGGSCVDAGAVQTAYSLAFTTSPSSTQLTEEPLTSSPVVQLSDNGSAIALAGASISIQLKNGSFSSGTTQANTGSNGAVTFSGLVVSTIESSDYLIASASAGTHTFTANSTDFNVNPPAPTVTGIFQVLGPAAGGTSITITGTNLTDATAVYFGTNTATSYTVDSASQITATSPAGTGTVDVTVTTPGGTSATSAADQFTYIAPSPETLTATGGTPQSAYVTTAFGAPLRATVLDMFGYPYSGASVTFTAPSSGASGSFSNSSNTITVTTNASGVASAGTLTANGIAGAYSVSAAVTGLSTVTFSLTNTAMPHYIVTSLVDDAGDVAANCTDQNLHGATPDSDCSLRDAIAAANAIAQTTVTPVTTSLMPTITFADTFCTNSGCTTTITPTADNPGTYNVTTGGTLTISANMNITGLGANLLSISGANTSGVATTEVFSILTGTVSISKLTITKGSSSGGGGIWSGGVLTISDCVFSGNTASDGGGIYNAITLTVSNSTFNGNTALARGGGISNSGNLNVSNSTFSGNTAVALGGGIYNGGGSTATVTDSTFSGNTAPTSSGPGIYNDGEIYLANNLSADNFANPSSNAIDYGGNVIAGWNSVSASSIKLSLLGNYGGPTQTMIPLPGSNGICSGTASPGGSLTLSSTDQRGNPHPTTVYTNGGAACVDAGAVQTAYSLVFTTSPAATQQPGMTLTPTSTVQLYDNGSLINLPGAPVSVTINNGTLAGAANPYSTGSTGLAAFDGLSVTTATTWMNDFLTASAAVGPYTITAKSTNFSVISITLSPTTLPAAQIGVAYSQQITASGGTAPYTYTATGLPTGLSVNTSTGLISGTPKSDTASPYSVTVTAIDSNGGLANQTYSLTVAAPAITLSPATLASGTYGASYNQSISASGGIGPYTYALAGGSSLPAGLNLSSSGAITGIPSAASASTSTFTIIATDTGSSCAPSACSGSQLVSLTINRATPAVAITLTSGANPVFAQTPITFTAAVGFSSGSGPGGPTGTVTFYDNGAVVTSCVGVTLTGGVATCTINGAATALTVGSNIITASYSGDSNFLPLLNTASTGYAETVVDFDFVMSNPVLTVTPGQSIQYAFTISPLSPATTFPEAIKFSVSGLPAGATYSFSPPSVGPCGSSCSTTVTLTIQTLPGSLSAAQAEPGAGGNLAARLAPFSLAFLLLPFAGRLRKAGKRFSRLLPILLLLAASLAAMAGMSGCGATIGFFGQTQHTYTVTITGSSGALSHTSNITLTVE
jgi:CSLREA domain-containing protein